MIPAQRTEQSAGIILQLSFLNTVFQRRNRNGYSILKQAIYKIRTDSNMQKRYDGFHFLSSRTVLSKGLEFECVIIDMSDPLKMKDFYVAMTRAMKKIYIISDTRQFTFS